MRSALSARLLRWLLLQQLLPTRIVQRSVLLQQAFDLPPPVLTLPLPWILAVGGVGRTGRVAVVVARQRHRADAVRVEEPATARRTLAALLLGGQAGRGRGEGGPVRERPVAVRLAVLVGLVRVQQMAHVGRVAALVRFDRAARLATAARHARHLREQLGRVVLRLEHVLLASLAVLLLLLVVVMVLMVAAFLCSERAHTGATVRCPVRPAVSIVQAVHHRTGGARAGGQLGRAAAPEQQLQLVRRALLRA